MRRQVVASVLWLWVLCLAGVPAVAQTIALDARVQVPQLKPPERGSVAGPLASVLFGPADVSRGGFSLAAPFSLPGERGAALANPFPSYSPENGLSEWGMGWANTLAITRWRALGALDYATDERTGPWGRLVAGADGAWYPAGLQSMARVEEVGDTLVATLPDGSRWTFGGTARVVTPRGTYAWYLTGVRTPQGRETQLTYEANASGRLFLKGLSFGGNGQDFQYQAELVYEPLTRPFRDVRSGSELLLDRRVTAVIARVHNAQTGTWDERWRHTLSYEGEGLGPAWFLTQVVQTFASGQSLPPLRYTYHKARESLAAAQLVRAPALDTVLGVEGFNATQPDHASLFDIDEDGRLDLEHNEDNTLWRQQDGAFVSEALPAMDPGTPPECRRTASTSNPTRLLAQMRHGDPLHQVVGLRTQNSSTETVLTLCTRAGEVLHSEVLRSGNWTPSANVRMVDVNQDQQPDFLRVSAGFYTLLPNLSTPAQFGFGTAVQKTLRPSFTPTASWVHDFNGDGLADIIARSASTVVVWLGRGDGTFLDTGLTYNIRTGSSRLTNLTDFHFTFLDANKDGLADLLLTRLVGTGTFLFLNDGQDFVQFLVPAFASLPSTAYKPVVGDFSSSGDTEVSYVIGGQAWAVAMDGAKTGLLATAEDGRGTTLRFEYARAPAQPGIRQRPSVLSALEVASSGYDTVRHTYAYSGATLHGVGRFLIGFDNVVRTSPGLVQDARFLHTDDAAGLPLSETQHDTQAPDLQTYTYQHYEDASFRGVAWKRLTEQGSGWSQSDGQTLGEHVRYEAFEDGRCASRTVQTNAYGTVTTESWRASVPGLSGALHCLMERTRVTGVHPDSALDFQHEVHLVRNSLGLVETVESVTPTETLVVQDVVYRPDFLIDHVTVPGRGTTSFEYTPGTLQLWRTTSPDGVVQEATERHPLTDALLSTTLYRGARQFSQHYRYDGLERLGRQWDTLGGASDTNPNLLFSYRYATATQPGSVLSEALVDDAAGALGTQMTWHTASGEQVGQALRIPEGWAVQGVTTRSRALLETKSYVRGPLAATVDLTAVDYSTLLAGADVLGTVRATGLGNEAQAFSRLHADVSREVLTGVALDAGVLMQEAVENGTHTTRRYLDAGRRMVAFEDEAGTRTSYDYDALGRLRRVRLPDGTGHRVAFDGHGRVSRVDREGTASVSFTYAPVTGLVSAKTYLSPAAQPMREESYTHDALGRTTRVRHTDLVQGTTQDFRFFFDGATPEEPQRADQPGLLTAVAGEGFSRRLEYRVDGALVRKTLSLTGWRTVESQVALREDGAPREEETCVRRADGTLVTCVTLAYAPDATGRPQSVSLNGTPLALLDYDAEGRLAEATVDGVIQVGFAYDALTRSQVGFSQSQAGVGVLSASSWHHNARGLIETENLSTGGLSLVRQHTYSPEGYLLTSTDAQHAYGYAYDVTGLPMSVETDGSLRSLHKQGGVSGGLTYTFDELGRTTSRGDLALTYGPDGNLALARRGTSEWEYLHDESGWRLLKKVGGVPVAAYLDGGAFLDESGLTQPLRIGGRLVGVLINGSFQPLATDMRGTVMAGLDGTPRVASPYGARGSHPETAAFDFVERAYDADLDMVRLGTRDYDPAISRFATPDLLFLESPERCVSSPVSCNLYSYAANNPVSFVDRNGQFEELVHGALTFRLLRLAGVPERDASIIATYSAGMDHFENTRPTTPEGGVHWGNLLGGHTTAIHFSSEADNDVRFMALNAADTDLPAFGMRLHGVEDYGVEQPFGYTYPDGEEMVTAPGPHARGLSPTALNPTIWPIPTAGHGFFTSETGDFSNFTNHIADQAFRSPKANSLLLEWVFRRMIEFATTRYGAGMTSEAYEQGLSEIQTVVSITTHAEAQDFAIRVGYQDLIDRINASHKLPDGTPLNAVTPGHYEWVYDSSLPR